MRVAPQWSGECGLGEVGVGEGCSGQVRLVEGRLVKVCVGEVCPVEPRAVMRLSENVARGSGWLLVGLADVGGFAVARSAGSPVFRRACIANKPPRTRLGGARANGLASRSSGVSRVALMGRHHIQCTVVLSGALAYLR